MAGTNCIQPAIIKFQNTEKEQESAPLLVRLLEPKIFAYTWQEEVPAFAIIEVKKEPVAQQNKKESAESASKTNTNLHFVLSGEDELSLLQENLYVEGSEAFVENTHFELLDGEIERVLQIEDLDVHQNYNFSQYSDMTQLIKDFYVIDASTSPDANLLDVDALKGYDCTIDKEAAGPQILIYHSHSQEGFANSIPGDVSTTIVGAGEKLTRLLEEEYGFLPPKPETLQFEETENFIPNFCAGKAISKKTQIISKWGKKEFSFPCYVSIPKKEGKHPFFVCINFRDNVPDRYIPVEEIIDKKNCIGISDGGSRLRGGCADEDSGGSA